MNALAFLPPSLRHAVQVREHAENRPEWIERAAERIATDADKVRELVDDAVGGTDDPLCSDSATGLLITLRDLKYVFKRLGEGDTLEQATKTPDEAQHWRALLRFADSSDTWITKLINDAAAEEVDAEGEE